MRVTGRVEALRGLTIIVSGLPIPVGSLVMIESAVGSAMPGEVVGFDGRTTTVMTLGQTSGVRPGDVVRGEQPSPTVPVSERMLGRVIDAMGEPIDGRGPIRMSARGLLSPEPTSPMARTRIVSRLTTGVRAIDCFTTLGKGQRIGVFAGPGVGKSTLMGSVARGTSADVNVIALIGERGREVREFIDDALGEAGLARSVVVVATSDQSPLMRIRAAHTASAVAEHFRDRGSDVMLMMDSITRYAHALRQVGLAVGEPPATKGYTPSVFAMLPRLLERAGTRTGSGTITGVYTILVEGDDMTEPVADAARGVLDGHIILDRALAQKAHFPAIDVLDSVSRVAGDVTDPEHIAARQEILRLLATHKKVEDLVQIGAYASGSDPVADTAIELKPSIDAVLQQSPHAVAPFDEARKQLLALAQRSAQTILARQRAAHAGVGAA
ncbi:MAG: FliI/YscN family ATPase [Phycisphaeraceae bacterium]|nr:FliI/YscN family ATPase [Phycisphaeraceae bacterium]